MPVLVDAITQNVNVLVNSAQSVEIVNGNMGPEGISIVLSKAVTSSAYTFSLVDKGIVVEGNSATAQTFTVPTNLGQPFPLGSVLEIFQLGVGQITIVGASGVTLLSSGGHVSTAAQYSTIGLRQRALNVWVISGDLA